MKKSSRFLIYALLILVTFLTLFPLLYALASSLRSDTELYKYAMPFSVRTLLPVEFTFASYVRLFKEFHFLKAIVNTVIVVAVLVPCGCLVNSIAAFAFSVFDFKFKNILFAVFMVSFMIPFEAIAMPLYNLIDAIGWVDTRAAMIVPAIANGLMLFLFRQFFSDMPASLIEAARVDGASWMTIYRKIMLPASVPVFITASLMQFMNSWNSYLWPLLVARSEAIRTIQIALASLKMEQETLWSCLYAGALVSALIPIMIFIPFQKYFVEGVTSSGVKG
ncbi:ABC transporter permease [Clostridium sp. chh4-2]|uniref:carbohydrate ABC transporter permease n=1 Tax=Clostridium sp. chh4-2 TaxID=2067550 RepID=UPI000CCE2BE7|nr:carbohydrate ABC transporter permease [Clostridium sp. chh4-2]PNV61248.1 ABC transporter permease [Clostridium sp. chh4-2]